MSVLVSKPVWNLWVHTEVQYSNELWGTGLEDINCFKLIQNQVDTFYDKGVVRDVLTW
jgi:hypothetical protein